MKYSLDCTSDYSNKELYTFLQGIPLPQFVKDAELDTRESVSKLATDSFADTYNKAFPINTPAGTYLSNVYFFNKKAELGKLWGKNYANTVQSRLEKAAEVHNIKEDVERYNKLADAKNSKDYQKEYLYTAKIASDELELFPVKTTADFIKAADFFSKNINRYPFEWRDEIAKSFIAKAAKYNVDDLPDLIGKYAGMFYPHQEDVKSELWRRSGKLTDTAKEKYAKLIEAVDGCDSYSAYFKLAQEAYLVELGDGIYQKEKVAHVLGDIVDKIFTLSIDKVAEMLDVVEMHGSLFDMKELQKVSTDIYKEAFGIDIDPSDSNQLRDVLPTMPLSDVSLFRERSGIQPV